MKQSLGVPGGTFGEIPGGTSIRNSGEMPKKITSGGVLGKIPEKFSGLIIYGIPRGKP